ncbi:MAG: hypothetical protein QM804_17595 [Propionicimonas sp.]
MSDTTTVRLSRASHEALRGVAARRGQTVTAVLERAVRLLEQEAMGADLAADLRDDERTWLDADAG